MKKFLCGLFLLSALLVSSPLVDTADPSGSPRIQSSDLS